MVSMQSSPPSPSPLEKKRRPGDGGKGVVCLM